MIQASALWHARDTRYFIGQGEFTVALLIAFG